VFSDPNSGFCALLAVEPNALEVFEPNALEVFEPNTEDITIVNQAISRT